MPQVGGDTQEKNSILFCCLFFFFFLPSFTISHPTSLCYCPKQGDELVGKACVFCSYLQVCDICICCQCFALDSQRSSALFCM